jgi:hypothetical protein
MSNRLMISVAAIALVAGAGLANAQGTGGRESGGAAAQQSAPSSAGGGAMGGVSGGASSGGAMQNRESTERPSGGASDTKSGADMKATPSEPKSSATGSQRAQEDMKGDMKGQKSKSMSSESETKGGKDMKAEGHESHDGNLKAEGREGRDNNMKAEGREGRDGNMKAEGREGRDGMKAESKSERSQTTGQAGAGARISTEQRTKITTVIREQKVAPVTNVNFSISVGARVPREVSYHPLPAEVVTIYPEWRGYDYILVRDQILVIDPATFEIVAVLDT